MSFPTKTRLRRPCFDPTHAAATGGTAAIDPSSKLHDASTLANFTKLRRKHLLLLDDRVDDNDAENDAGDGSSHVHGCDAHGKNDEDNVGSTEAGNRNKEPSLEQCIALLEPHLAAFRLKCDARVRERQRAKRVVEDGKMKAKKKSKLNKNQSMNGQHDELDEMESRNSMIDELMKENIENGSRTKHLSQKLGGMSDNRDTFDCEEKNDINNNQKERKIIDEDEVPPQIVRMARFFPWRWLPIKKALLRPPPISLLLTNTSEEENTRINHEMNHNLSCAEVGIAYRLRLARAAYKKGMLGRAEYESLLGACNTTFQKGGKRKLGISDESDDGLYDKLDGNIHHSKRINSSSSDSYLKERIRLALMRLPTDAIIPENSMSAWHHVKEMLSECERHWQTVMMHRENDAKREENERSQQLNGPKAKEQFYTDDDDLGSKPSSKGESSVTPDEVAEWALTSWTALLISQGLDPARPMHDPNPPLRCGNRGIININNTSIGETASKIEKQFAFLLSNRPSESFKPKTFDRSRSHHSCHKFLTSAVTNRIDELLSPSNIESLNGIHLLSLGRLFYQFASREEAERHILQSIIRCSFVGGLVGVSQLSRILAVFVCGMKFSSQHLSSVEENSFDHGIKNPVSANNVSDLEHDLQSRLDDSEMVMNVVMNHCKEENSEEDMDSRRNPENSSNKQREEEARIMLGAKSYLEVVLHGAAHLVRFASMK